MNQTIHTKEALSEMQQLWFSKPASPVPLISKPKAAAKSILKPSKPCFNLYVDESCLVTPKTSDDDKPLDLTLKSQDADCSEKESSNQKLSNVPNSNIPTSNLIDKLEDVDKENCFVNENFLPVKTICETESDEDKENGVPPDYCGPVGKSNRKVSGILTPAENIEIAQLSDEEVI